MKAGRQHTPKREVACILGVAVSAAARASSASALLTVTSCTMYMSDTVSVFNLALWRKIGNFMLSLKFQGAQCVTTSQPTGPVCI